LKGKAE